LTCGSTKGQIKVAGRADQAGRLGPDPFHRGDPVPFDVDVRSSAIGQGAALHEHI